MRVWQQRVSEILRTPRRRTSAARQARAHYAKFIPNSEIFPVVFGTSTDGVKVRKELKVGLGREEFCKRLRAQRPTALDQLQTSRIKNYAGDGPMVGP